MSNKTNSMSLLVHPWEAVFDTNSQILILGSFPSPKSRENGFYYGNSQNIFWQTLSSVLGVSEPSSDITTKKTFLLENKIALWDVLHSCEIDGADDSSIINPTPNKFAPLLRNSRIKAIFTTGKKATELFQDLCVEEIGISAIYLPSTSPANRARQKNAEFLRQWARIKRYLD